MAVNQASRDYVVALNRRCSDLARARIRVSLLIRRLDDCAHGKVELNTSQVQAIKILLDKALSNAPTKQEHTGADGKSLKVTFGE